MILMDTNCRVNRDNNGFFKHTQACEGNECLFYSEIDLFHDYIYVIL